MHGAIPPFPQYDFMPWSSVKAQGKLYLFVGFYSDVSFTLV
jgi:hypothetical protein